MSELESYPLEYRRTISNPIKSLGFIGYNVFADKGNFFKRHAKLMAFTTYWIINTLSVLASMLMKKHLTNLGVPIAIGFSMLAMQYLLILGCMVANRQQLRGIIEDIGELWPRDLSESIQKEKLCESYNRKTQYFAKTLRSFGVIAVIYFNSSGVLRSAYNFWNGDPTFVSVFPLYYPFQINSWPCYLSVIISQAVFEFTIYNSMALASDILFLTLTIDLSILFYILAMDIENILEPCDEFGKNIFPDMEIPSVTHDKIKELVIRHQKLIGIANRIRESSSSIIFIATCASSIMSAFFIYLSTVSYGWDSLLYIMAEITIIFKIANYAWPGQALQDSSMSIGIAAYNCKWYSRGFKLTDRKSIMLMILRSQRPCNLSILNLRNINLEIFATFFNASLSYLSILRQLYQDD